MSLSYHPLANIFPLMDGDDFAALVEDIRANGVHEPVVLYEGQILDGRNRYRASGEAGVDCPLATYRGDDPVAYVVSLNLRRRHLNESQRAMVAAQLANMPRGSRTDLASIEAKSDEQAAALLNVSEASVERAKAVRREGVPELVDLVERGEVSVSAAADVARLPQPAQREIVARGEREILEAAKRIRAESAEVRRLDRVAKLVEISKGNSTIRTDRKFPVIYADPPWRYEHPPMGGNRVIENHYPTMRLVEICAIPVADLATPDAILFLWATAPKLGECLDVMAAWGFDYRTCAVWVKDKIGMGYYLRNQHELLLIGRRGDPPMPYESDRRSSVITAPRTEHSVKPIEFYELIESMYPDLPKIELFARNPREGWERWGNQAEAAE